MRCLSKERKLKIPMTPSAGEDVEKLDLAYIPLSILNLLSHCPPASIVSSEESAVNFIHYLVRDASFFSLAALKIFSAWNIFTVVCL